MVNHPNRNRQLTPPQGSNYTFSPASRIYTGDQILVSGEWRPVIRIAHLNRAPVQLYEFYLADLDECIRIPDDWSIKVIRALSSLSKLL